MKNILFKFSKLVSVFFLLLFTLFLILTILVSFKPIKINNFKAFEDIKILQDSKVKEFGNIFLSFNKYSRNYEIFIEDVRTNNSLIPNILLGIRFKDILFLKLRPTILKLYDADIIFNVKKNNNQLIQQDNFLNFFIEKINNAEYSAYLDDFQIFEVNNSKLKIKLSDSEDYFFSRIDLKIEKKKDDVTISALIEQNEKLQSFATFNARKKASKLAIDFSFEDFNLDIPNRYLETINLAESKIILNGKYSLIFDSNVNTFENNSSLKFNSQIAKTFEGKTEELNFNNGKIDISSDKDLTSISFDFFETNSKFKIAYNFSHKDYKNKSLEINISEIKLEKIKTFWPQSYKDSVKEWISQNASGDINELSLRLNYDKKGLVENSSLKFNFSNTNIRYSEDKPLVKELEGNASFNGTEFKFDISSGVSDKLILNNASVKLYDFDQEIEMADIQLEITGNNYNLTTYLEKILFNPDSIKRISKFNGNPILKLNLKFPLLVDLKFNDIAYEGQLNYNNSKIPDFFQNYDLEKVNIKINITSDRFNYDGNADFQKMSIKFSGIEYINESQNFQNNMSIDINFDPLILNDYFPDFVEDNEGFIPLSIKYYYNLENDNYEVVGEGPTDKLSAFFTFFNLNHNFLQGNLKFQLSGKKKINERFELKINTKDLKLFVESRKYSNELSEIIVHSIKSPSQDFSAEIRKKKNFWKADLSGSNLNLMKVLENNNSITKKNVPVKFNITTKSLVLKKKKIFVNSFHGILENSKFSELNINFNTPISVNNDIRIYNENEKKKLSIISDDASEFLEVFDMNPNLKSGKLYVEAERDSNRNYVGNIKVTDFVAYDTPFFAKVLTLFSLDGIEQKLKDGGIFFNRLNSNFTFRDGDIKFSDGIMRGSDLGLTFKGDFDSTTDNFQADGTFIPAYTINTLLTSLPVVGDIITAGSPEDGILAASFELKKENEKFDINFNPVSVLVPSLIRNLFKTE